MPNHYRKPTRLEGYDYSLSGMYFVTICTYQRLHLFGEIISDEMVHNHWGEIAHNEWQKTETSRPNVVLDAFVVMPNHTHAIIAILDESLDGRGLMHQTSTITPPHPPQFGKPVAGALGTIIATYKAAVSRHMNRLPNSPEHPIWQRNYYDHIVRGEKDLNAIRQYIETNPARWAEDSLYG